MALSMHPEEGLSGIYSEHNPLTAENRTAEKKTECNLLATLR